MHTEYLISGPTQYLIWGLNFFEGCDWLRMVAIGFVK